MDIKKLCIDLATKENGKEIIKILKKYNLWDNKNHWKFFAYEVYPVT